MASTELHSSASLVGTMPSHGIVPRVVVARFSKAGGSSQVFLGEVFPGEGTLAQKWRHVRYRPPLRRDLTFHPKLSSLLSFTGWGESRDFLLQCGDGRQKSWPREARRCKISS